MPPVGFEPTIPGNKQPQTHVLDRAATGVGLKGQYRPVIKVGLKNVVLPQSGTFRQQERLGCKYKHH